MISSDIIKINQLSKSFMVGDQLIPVLKSISFSVQKNDFMVIYGPSGCGKSTLLHTLLGLEVPTKGDVIFNNVSLYDGYDEDFRSEFRKTNIGMVYQQPNWIKSLRVIDNVAFPLTLLGYSHQIRLSKAKELLSLVKMENWANYFPSELSSGQQQKVALARALINDPKVIIADEPTGNLDYDSGRELMDLLSQLNHDSNKTIIMVTHDLEYLKYSRKAIKMLDGQIVNQSNSNKVDDKIKFKRLKVDE